MPSEWGSDKVPRTEDEVPPMVAAAAWVSRISTVSLLMVLPGVAGLWLDRWLGTKVVLTLLGFALGLTAGIRQLVRMTSSPLRLDNRSQPKPNGPSDQSTKTDGLT